MADAEGGAVPIISQTGDQSNQVKIAVKLTAFPDTTKAIYVTLIEEQELRSVVAELAKEWDLDSEAFQLQFDSKRMPNPPIYITEENRAQINTGDVLSLDFTAERMLLVTKQAIDGGNMSKFLMEKLLRYCTDKSFAEIFIASSGLDTLHSYLSRNVTDAGLNSQYASALQCVVGLVEHDVVTWSSMDANIAKTAIKVLRRTSNTNSRIVRLCLMITESAVSNSTSGPAIVSQLELDVFSFFHNIRIQEQDIQSKCVALVNTIFSLLSGNRREDIKKYIWSPPIRTLIKEKIFTLPIQEELAYQLFLLQTNMFNLLHNRLMTPIDPTKDDSATKSITDLYQKAFEDNDVEGAAIPATPLRKGETRDLSRLGFKNAKEPLYVSIPAAEFRFLMHTASFGWEYNYAE